MPVSIKEDDWVYAVFIIGPTLGNDQLLGQRDAETDVSFIAIFTSKDDALMCFNQLVKDDQKKHEVQAILFSEAKDYARSAGFAVYALDGKGQILDKLS